MDKIKKWGTCLSALKRWKEVGTGTIVLISSSGEFAHSFLFQKTLIKDFSFIFNKLVIGIMYTFCKDMLRNDEFSWNCRTKVLLLKYEFDKGKLIER